MFNRIDVRHNGEILGYAISDTIVPPIPIVGNYIKVKGMVIEHRIKEVILDYEKEIIIVRV